MLSKLLSLFSFPVDYKNRYYGLDILRGIGILVVLYAHGRSKIPYFEEFNLFISVIGFWLMDLFFCQSGFLIGLMLIKQFERRQTFKLKDAKSFWIRRWFRTLPNYYLVLVLTATLWLFLEGKNMFLTKNFLAHIFFAHTIKNVSPHFMIESWTLCIEEWFYLLFPISLILISSVVSKTGKSVKQRMLLAIALLFLFPLLLRLFAFIIHVKFSWYELATMSFFRLDSIAYGILLAWFTYYYADLIKQNRNKFGIVFLIAMAVYIIYFYVYLLENFMNRGNIYVYIFFFLLSGITSFCLTAYMKDLKYKNMNNWVRFITYISIISYSVYLFHQSIVMYLINHFLAPKTVVENIATFAVYAITTIAISALVYKYFEHPITGLRERFDRKNVNK